MSPIISKPNKYLPVTITREAFENLHQNSDIDSIRHNRDINPNFIFLDVESLEVISPDCRNFIDEHFPQLLDHALFETCNLIMFSY